jgi:hypothetical protein
MSATTPAVPIASLERALSGIEDRLSERETDLAQSRRQSADLGKQFDHPFEHEERLVDATKRQQKLIAALNITKSQATATAAEMTDQTRALAHEKCQSNRAITIALPQALCG